MKRVMKIGGLVIAGIVGVAACAALVLFIVGRSKAANTDMLAVHSVSISTDSASVARGDHLVNAIAACASCHGDDMAGKTFGTPAALVSMSAPNLTKGGIAAKFSDADWDRAIRHGIGGDGRRLIIMPSEHYSALSDSDFVAMVAYLRSLPASTNVFPERRIGPLGGVLIGVGALPLSANTIAHDSVGHSYIAAGTTAAYGRYVATIASCASCHGEDLNGKPAEHGAPAGPSLLALASTWSRDDFAQALRSGKNKGGKPLSDEMPWKVYRHMTDDELTALWEYVKQEQQRKVAGRGA